MGFERMPEGVVEKFGQTMKWSELVIEAVNDTDDTRASEILFKKKMNFY